MSMGASQSPHHQRMAYPIFCQPRIPHYPQVRSSYTLITEILFYTINYIIQQTRLTYYGILIMKSFEKSKFSQYFTFFPLTLILKSIILITKNIDKTRFIEVGKAFNFIYRYS